MAADEEALGDGDVLAEPEDVAALSQEGQPPGRVERQVVGGLRLQAQELLVAAGTGDLGRELRDVAVPRVDPVVTLVVFLGLSVLRYLLVAFLFLYYPLFFLVLLPFFFFFS